MEKMHWKSAILIFMVLYTTIDLATCFNHQLDEAGKRMAIKNGMLYKRKMAPHHVMVLRGEDKYCGGSLISPEYVITASQCIDEKDRSASLKITPGSDLNIESPNGVTAKYVSEIKANGQTGHLVLLKMDKEFNSKKVKNVKPIKLANNEPDLHDKIIVFGYDESDNTKVQQFKARITKVSGGELCAIPSGNTETPESCPGDNGNGILNTNGQLIGVYTKKDGSDCDSGEFCFVNLYKRKDYIKNRISVDKPSSLKKKLKGWFSLGKKRY